MDHEIDKQIEVQEYSDVIAVLICCVKRAIEAIAKAPNQSIFVTTFTYGHELWVISKK